MTLTLLFTLPSHYNNIMIQSDPESAITIIQGDPEKVSPFNIYKPLTANVS